MHQPFLFIPSSITTLTVWSIAHIIIAALSFGALSVLAVGTTIDQKCIEACSDYSGSLNFCRDAFKFKRELLYPFHLLSIMSDRADKGGIVAQDRKIELATEHARCMCEGSRGDGNLGAEKMKNSISVCGGCGITPDVIKTNLDVSTYLLGFIDKRERET